MLKVKKERESDNFILLGIIQINTSVWMNNFVLNVTQQNIWTNLKENVHSEQSKDLHYLNNQIWDHLTYLLNLSYLSCCLTNKRNHKMIKHVYNNSCFVSKKILVVTNITN
jgi:hypothetical protein